MNVEIRQLESNEMVPMELLLLADPSEEMISNYLGRGTCFVAIRNNETVGVMVLVPTRLETMEIVNIAVKEHFQGMGIGRTLLNYAIHYSKEQGGRYLEIGTGNSSVNQLLIYQKCGFRIVGVEQDFFIKHYKDEIYENGIQCRDMIRLKLELRTAYQRG